MPGRVFVLGAGVSKNETVNHTLPLPLSSEFFMTKYIESCWNKVDRGYDFSESPLVKLMKHYFGFDPKESQKGKINIEEVYSFLFTSLRVFPNNFHDRSIFESARQDLMYFISNVITNCNRDAEGLNFYNKLAQNLREGDSIISFNWDLLVDKALKKTEAGKVLLNSQEYIINPYSEITGTVNNYAPIAKNNTHRGYLLKIHGAVNLTACVDNKCIRNRIPYRFDIDEESTTFWDCVSCGNACEVLIMPPHIHKTYMENSFFMRQARMAVKKISLASEIYIIGYSFPIFDFEARTMFKCARLELGKIKHMETFLKRIIIVNPEVSNEGFINEITDIFGLSKSEENYGHTVDLIKYQSIDEFTEKELC